MRGWQMRSSLPAPCGCGRTGRVALCLGSTTQLLQPAPSTDSVVAAQTLAGESLLVRRATCCKASFTSSWLTEALPVDTGALVLSHLLAPYAQSRLPVVRILLLATRPGAESLRARLSCVLSQPLLSVPALLRQLRICWNSCGLHGMRLCCDSTIAHRLPPLSCVVCCRYRTVAERLLCAQLVHSRDDMSRVLSLDFLNRQLVWRELSDVLLFTLPLLHSLRNRYGCRVVLHRRSSLAALSACTTASCP